LLRVVRIELPGPDIWYATRFAGATCPRSIPLGAVGAGTASPRRWMALTYGDVAGRRPTSLGAVIYLEPVRAFDKPTAALEPCSQNSAVCNLVLAGGGTCYGNSRLLRTGRRWWPARDPDRQRGVQRTANILSDPIRLSLVCSCVADDAVYIRGHGATCHASDVHNQ